MPALLLEVEGPLFTAPKGGNRRDDHGSPRRQTARFENVKREAFSANVGREVRRPSATPGDDV